MFSKDLVKWDRIKARLISLVYGEYFTDALRNTITIILPFSLLFFYHQPNMAIGVGVGALLISLTDSPGNRANKFKSAIISIISFFFTALIISSSLGNPWLTAGSIFLLTFVFSMLAMFGSRMALIGTMAIILGIFTLGLHPENPLLFSWYILLGGYWYYLISLIQIVIWPYRSLHQAIFECITATSVFLKSKARYYDPEVNLEECYSETIALHIKVSEKQELVRNLLLSDKRAMKPTNERGQQLLRTAVSVIDLYEQVTAIHYDYAYVRKSLDKTGALNLIIELIETLAEELQVLSGVFLRPKKTQSALRLIKFEQARAELTKLALSTDETNAHIIHKVLKNLEGIVLHIQVIKQDQPMSALPANLDSGEDIAYADFLSPQLFKLSALKQYFSFSSAVFRFSLRLALLCFLAYLINLVFPLGKYNYWLLLTIVIVAKPRFGLTWRRNVERLSGTLIGAVIGIVLLLIIHQIAALLIISAFLLLGFFTFNRIRYSVSVVCITAMVILCLSIYDGHSDHVIMERVIYTILGCAIAFLAAFLFPIWEIKGLKALISNILKANSNYLTKVKAELRGTENGIGASKLARKNSYIQLAKFSETLQYMHLEPNSKALDMHGIYAIQILSYRINSIIASLSLSAKQYVKQDSGMLIVSEALSNMEYCIQHSNRLDLAKINEVLHADKIEEEYNDNEGTLQHQLNLLLALSVELKMYFI
ncbi:FUSC family protein [Pedobacter sp. PLR]|uniref:FUSC family protein n=1 Tax=Pedobacter sp. PLR TaxID=2994465 RepID=UPI0022481F74|nr:FUSC family membrane protein [Pedobacter sp. PLR]MCX2452559.1 FUSC family protein [Pedobacter sp. PLR]